MASLLSIDHEVESPAGDSNGILTNSAVPGAAVCLKCKQLECAPTLSGLGPGGRNPLGPLCSASDNTAIAGFVKDRVGHRGCATDKTAR